MLHRSSCADMPSPISRRIGLGAFVARFPSRGSLPREFDRVGLRISLFGTCSAFTHVMACQLAESPKATLYIEGFSRFVTSTTAPIATGWSDSCRAGLTPAGRPCLCTAHEFIDYWRVGCAAWLRSSCLTRASRRALRALQPRRLLVSRRNSSSILYVIRCASAVAPRCCSGRGLLAARRRTA